MVHVCTSSDCRITPYRQSVKLSSGWEGIECPDSWGDAAPDLIALEDLAKGAGEVRCKLSWEVAKGSGHSRRECAFFVSLDPPPPAPKCPSAWMVQMRELLGLLVSQRVGPRVSAGSSKGLWCGNPSCFFHTVCFILSPLCLQFCVFCFGYRIITVVATILHRTRLWSLPRKLPQMPPSLMMKQWVNKMY